MKKIILIITLLVVGVFGQENRLKTSVSLIRLDNNTLEANVTFQNISDKPLRIYFIESPVFNSFQSMFHVGHADGSIEFIVSDPHPHGISVDASDFHLIDANKSKTFTQKLDNIELRLKTKPAKLIWVYVNDVTKWEGGRSTLDGPTKELFDGKEIPYIWTGEVRASTKL